MSIERSTEEHTVLEKPAFTLPVESPENKEVAKNIWEDSRVLAEQRENIEKGLGVRIAFLDIDSTTVAGNDEETIAAIKALREKGFSIVFLTARPTEWQMRNATLMGSNMHGGLNRPAPMTIFGENGPGYLSPDAETYIIPETRMPLEILDPAVIGGANGTQLAVLEENGKFYNADAEIAGDRDPEEWRLQAYDMIDYLNVKAKLINIDFLGSPIKGMSPIDFHRAPARLSDIDIVDAFDEGEIGHKPHDFKIACHFNSVAEKKIFMRLLDELRTDDTVPVSLREFAQNVDVIDDSNPDREITVKRGTHEEKITDYTMHLVPKGTGKEYAADHVLKKVTEELNKGKDEADKIKTEDVQIFIAGDSYHDLKMGLEAADDATVNFVIAGGSRLYKYFIEGRRDFGGEDFGKDILDHLEPVKEREVDSAEVETPINLTQDGALHYQYRNPKTGKVRDVYLYAPDKKGPVSLKSAVERMY